jgi:hypothetical protein
VARVVQRAKSNLYRALPSRCLRKTAISEIARGFDLSRRQL